MKLLIFTQKVDENDDLLGFFHSWIKEFSKHYEKIIVISLGVGKYDLPDNVKVLSLGKEVVSPLPRKGEGWGEGVKVKLKYIFNFYKYIWQERKNYDKVFVHMNPEYVVLGGLLWRILSKRIALWYVHKNVDLKLKLAEIFVNVIFTASKESFLLKSKKINIVGHGIDVDLLQTKDRELTTDKKEFNIIYIGRISPIKDQELLLRTVGLLVKNQRNPQLKVKLIGGTVNKNDDDYFELLKDTVKKERIEEYVEFIGPIANKNILPFYQEADLHINLCPTGGMDKAVLEAMACGVPTVVLNKTFNSVFGEYGNKLILESPNVAELLEKIKNLQEMAPQDMNTLKKFLRSKAEQNFSLGELVKNIILLS